MSFDNKNKSSNIRTKLLSRNEWDRLLSHIGKNELNEEKCQKGIEAREKIRQESYEIHKNWTNTLVGMRNKKLEEREERMRKDEEERVAVDQEWAKQQAEERRQKLCYARMLQLYTTPRIKSFHNALHLSDALKENELQLKLKALKSEAAAKSREIEFEDMKKSLKEAEEEELKKSEERKEVELAIRKEQLRQIENRRNLEAKERAELAAEGERIRQLAKEAEERNHQRMEEKLKRQQEIAREQREQTEHKNKLQQNERIKEEEENEKELLYTVTNCKIGKNAHKKNAALKAAQEIVQDKLAKYLAERIQKENEFREATLQAALKEDDDRWNRRIEEECRKQNETIKGIEAYREKVMKERDEQRIRNAEKAKGELRRLQEMDEKNRLEDEERKAVNLQKSRELVQLYMEEMKRHKDEREKLREESHLGASKFMQQIEDQEEMFQDYAKRVLKNCEETGIPTCAMKKVANQKSVDGFGIGIIDTNKEECAILPDLPTFKVHLNL